MQEAFHRAQHERFKRDELPSVIKEAENTVWEINLIVRSIQSAEQEDREIPNIKEALRRFVSPIQEYLPPTLTLDTWQEHRHQVSINYNPKNNSLVRKEVGTDKKPITEETTNSNKAWIMFGPKIPTAITVELKTKFQN